jgi:hypothetical protein
MAAAAMTSQGGYGSETAFLLEPPSAIAARRAMIGVGG